MSKDRTRMPDEDVKREPDMARSCGPGGGGGGEDVTHRFWKLVGDFFDVSRGPRSFVFFEKDSPAEAS
jgi:hypothetical protein